MLGIPGNIRPDPNHGQNFLVNPQIFEREMEYASVSSDDTVLEIGCGFGNLTECLVRRAGRVVGMEIDRQFEPGLSKLASENGNFDIVWGDALEAEFPRFDKVVANLPYRIALPLIFRLVEHEFHTAVLIIQQSLAQRLCAGPGEPGYSRLSVILYREAGLRFLEVVKRREFRPKPRVDSAMIRLRKIRARYEVPSMGEFTLLLDHLFRHREEHLADALAAIPEGNALRRAVANKMPELLRMAVGSIRPEQFADIANLAHTCEMKLPPLSNDHKRTSQKRGDRKPLPKYKRTKRGKESRRGKQRIRRRRAFGK